MVALSNVSNPSNAQNVTKSVVVSEDVASKTVAALAVLHTLYSVMGNGTKLPDFNACTTQDLEIVCKRALTALVRLGESKKEDIVRMFRGKVDAVVESKMNAARSAKAEYDSLSPALKAIMPTFPAVVTIPLMAFAGVFPSTYKSQDIASKLLGFGFKGDNAAKGPKAGIQHCTAIVVPFKAKGDIAQAATCTPVAPVVIASNVTDIVVASSVTATIDDNGDIIIGSDIEGDMSEDASVEV